MNLIDRETTAYQKHVQDQVACEFQFLSVILISGLILLTILLPNARKCGPGQIFDYLIQVFL